MNRCKDDECINIYVFLNYTENFKILWEIYSQVIFINFVHNTREWSFLKKPTHQCVTMLVLKYVRILIKPWQYFVIVSILCRPKFTIARHKSNQFIKEKPSWESKKRLNSNWQPKFEPIDLLGTHWVIKVVWNFN